MSLTDLQTVEVLAEDSARYKFVTAPENVVRIFDYFGKQIPHPVTLAYLNYTNQIFNVNYVFSIFSYTQVLGWLVYQTHRFAQWSLGDEKYQTYLLDVYGGNYEQ